MNFKNIKVKLTENDKLILLKYLNICTDLNGHSCNIIDLKKESSKLDLQFIY